METAENSISERLSGIWGNLTHNQRRFVVAMQEFPTKKAAAESIDLEPDTVYRWPEDVDEAIVLMSRDVREAATGVLAAALAKAAMTKVAGLDSGDERTRQQVAAEILDRMLGKATQRSEVQHEGEGRLVIEYVNDWREHDGEN